MHATKPRFRWAMLGLAIAFSLSVLCSLSLADPQQQAAKVIDEFLTAIKQNDQIDQATIAKAVKTVESLRGDEFDAYLAVTEGLCDLYPDYRQTLEMLGDEDLEPAVQSLTELAKSGDPYLAADATFYLARTKMLQEQYEDALPLLTELTGKMAGKSVQIGNATYLLAVSQARMLQRQEAIASFDKYLKEYPNAPERMRIGAMRQLQQMQFVEEGSLDDVWERMDFSRRHLKLTRTGDKTQEEQDKIIAMLDQLIKKAEEKECNCSGEGQGEGEQQQGEGEGQEGQGKGAKGGNSQNENGRVTRVFRRGPESPWSKLRDKDRDPAFSAIKEKFPARYQQLIEQYYKSFQEGVE